MSNYGKLLQYGERKAQEEVIKFLYEIAPGFLAGYGVVIPSEQLLPIIELGVEQTLLLCQDDLLPTVNAAIEDLKNADWNPM